MNLIFKIIEYNQETNQIIVKFCRQNSPKPIDDYSSGVIDCSNIDLNDYHQFVASIMRYGVDTILRQEAEEPILSENISSEVIETTDIQTQLNRVISLNSDELIAITYQMNKVNLD